MLIAENNYLCNNIIIMDEQKLAYLSFIQRENEDYHHTYDEELLQYEYLRDGDPRAIEESKRLFRSGITGKLSEDPLRDKKYLFVASVTLSTRFAIEGGLDAMEAYNLSDLYIQKMDLCRSIDEVYELQTEMITTFTNRLAELRKKSRSDSTSGNSSVSRQVSEALDYIYYNLHTKLTLEDIASVAGVSPNYLNSLFKKEKGVTIQKYIRAKRIEAARNMLRYSDYKETEISEILAFSGSSHFIKVFREDVGMTPKEYRAKNYRKHNRWSNNNSSSY